MDPAERDLDTGKLGRVGQRGSGLERGDRGRVLAEPSEQLADPRMQRRPCPAAERDRRLEMVDRLAVGEDRLGPIGRLAERRGRLGRPAGLALVGGDRAQTGSGRRGPSPAGSSRSASAVRGMEQPAPGEAGRLVGDVAHPAVDEVVATDGPTGLGTSRTIPRRISSSRASTVSSSDRPLAGGRSRGRTTGR